MNLLIIYNLIAISLGAATLERRVENGQAATEDYPFFVGIYSRTYRMLTCGGVIIHNNVILTAHHCVYANPDYLSVYFKSNRNGIQNELEEYQIEEIQRSKNHKRVFGQMNKSDVAYLILKTAIKGAQPIKPVSSTAIKMGKLIGWGHGPRKLKEMSEWQISEGDFNILSKSRCKELYDEEVELLATKYKKKQALELGEFEDDTIICTRGANDDIYGSNADSGGPLVVKVGDQYQLVGIVWYRIDLPEIDKIYTVFGNATSLDRFFKN